MIGERFAGPRIFGVAGPEHTEVALDFLVGHARVIGNPAFAGDAQLLEDLARTGKRESVRPLERARDVLDDAPVLPRLAGTLHGLVDLDDAALDLRDQPFILLVKRAGQHDVGMAGRVVQEEIDGDEKLELLETS